MLAFVHIIDNQIDHKQAPLVALLNKCRSYACVYARMVSHAISQKITIQPLQLISTLQYFLITINNNYTKKTLIQLHYKVFIYVIM